MYSPENASMLKKDVEFDIDSRVTDFEVIKLRLQNADYEKVFIRSLEDKYNQKESLGPDTFKNTANNFSEFKHKYFERLDTTILSNEQSKSSFPEVYQETLEKQSFKKDIENWIQSSSLNNPEYKSQIEIVKKDLDSYAKGNISSDEMRRKSENTLYRTAFEDNLRLQAYSKSELSVTQAEAHIQKFSLEKFGDRSKDKIISHTENSKSKGSEYDPAHAKMDLEKWDKSEIKATELTKKLSSPEYKKAFETALKQQYERDCHNESDYGHHFKGTVQERSQQFVAMRMKGIETTYKTAIKYEIFRGSVISDWAAKNIELAKDKTKDRSLER